MQKGKKYIRKTVRFKRLNYRTVMEEEQAQ